MLIFWVIEDRCGQDVAFLGLLFPCKNTGRNPWSRFIAVIASVVLLNENGEI